MDKEKVPFKPMLQGAGVDVRESGVLFVKPRFGLQKRPRQVSLTGVCLEVQEIDNNGEATNRKYTIDKAKLQVQRQSFRIVLVLASKEKLALYASNGVDMERWVKALTDAIQWKVQRFYEIGEEIGAGAFSTVSKGTHKDSGAPVAIKVIHKGSCSEEDMKYFQREIDIARSLKHDYVTRTLDCFESEKYLYIVVEFMAGGALGDMVSKFKVISETSAKLIMEHIFRGLEYIHDSGVVHRDIKPDNLLCTSTTLPTDVKLTDFGLARRTECNTMSGAEVEDEALGPEGLMTTPVGTPNFVAPEVLHGLPYGKEVDLFSCGVVMYYLLSGRYPFEESDPQRLIERIKKSEYTFPKEQWQFLSDAAKDLIDRLLDRSPYTRISADEALQHVWLVGPLRTSSAADKTQTRPGPNRRLQRVTRISLAPMPATHLPRGEIDMSNHKLQSRKSRLPERKDEKNLSPTGIQDSNPSATDYAI